MLEVIVAIVAIVVGVITGGATVALAVITGRYVRLTKDILEENRQMRLDAQKPKIVIYLHQIFENVPARTQTRRRSGQYDEHHTPARKKIKTYICVENIGLGIAYDLRFEKVPKFKPDLLIESAPIFSEGVNCLKPGGLKGCLIQSFTKEHEKQIKTPFKINVTYKGSRKEKYGEPFCIDFNETRGVLDAVPEN